MGFDSSKNESILRGIKKGVKMSKCVVNCTGEKKIFRKAEEDEWQESVKCGET